jgi:acetyltransferase-like isoleucine patch superfamily enzyme
MELASIFTRFRSRLRRVVLGRRLGIRIAADVYIAPTAQIQLESDGWKLGGTIRIANGVRLSDGVILAPFGGSIVLEENVYVGPYSVLYGHGGLRIGRDCMIAAHCVLIPSNHRFDDPASPIRRQGASSQGIRIGRDVWLGAGVKILDGVSLGDGCVIGAGAVVNRNLDPNSIAVGVPARVIATRGGSREQAIALAAGELS